jgi:RNA polymerase sigma-70 factor, ECF subfamily
VSAEIDSWLEKTFRADYGKLFATLARRLNDFHLAEDALAEAIAAAAATWPHTGLPAQPAAWLAVAARNAAVSAIRRDAVARDKQDRVAALLAPADPEDGEIPDDRLRLIFTCCHPALALEARVALTLHTLCGLSTPAIARLFFVSEPTIAQRIVRAKRKIKMTRIPYQVPAAEQIDDRLDAALAVIYLTFTQGYTWHDGERSLELCDEAIRLARLCCALVPGHAEARGLLALMLLHHARRDARDDGTMPVALDEQDRTRWHHDEIAAGTRELDHALARGPVGPYQIQASIAALHAEPETDWPQIAGLYAELVRRQPSPSAALALAIAEGMAHGPAHGLARIAELEAAGALAGSTRIDAARADLLRRAGRFDEATAAYDRAAATASDRDRRYFARRAAECRQSFAGIQKSRG